MKETGEVAGTIGKELLVVLGFKQGVSFEMRMVLVTKISLRGQKVN